MDVSRMYHVTDLFAILAGLFVQHTLYGIVLAANLQQKAMSDKVLLLQKGFAKIQ